MENIENRIEKIEARNSSVESDKAWETSNVRRVAIMILTYLVIVAYMTTIEVENPWTNAVIPVLGFLLSTFTISRIKKAWIKYLYKKN